MKLPPLYQIEQTFTDESIADITAAVQGQFAGFDFEGKIKPGQTIGVGVASRGTHDLQELVRATVDCLKELGLKPYIFPAMGSHGGGKADGMIEVLAGLGVTEATMGVKIVSSSETVSLGKIESGAEVFFCKDALQADHIMVINRVKPHTAFRAEVESGLCKILAVGCGRQIGASNMHKYALGQTIVPAARLIIDKTPVLCGLAVTETASGGSHTVRLVKAADFPASDAELLKEAWELFPRLPMDDLDVLVVEEMGKDVSGAGMDPNIIGFWRREGGERKPDFRCLVVLGLTEVSHGNATGMGMADLTTKAMIDSIDYQATYLNALTSRVYRSARQPIPLADDKAAIEQAFDSVAEPLKARAGRIVSTLEIGRFWVTEPVAEELRGKPGITVGQEPIAWRFDRNNRLEPME